MRTFVFVFGLLVISVSWNPPFNEAVIFKLTNVVCKSYNESWIVINKCRLKALRRDVTVLYFNGTVQHPVFEISAQMKLYKRLNGYKPWLVNMNIDCCRFLRKAYNPTARLIIGLFLDFTNVNHTCPYVGDLIVDGFYLRPELLRLTLPTGDYKLVLRWSYGKKLTFDTNVSFQFVENLMDQ